MNAKPLIAVAGLAAGAVFAGQLVAGPASVTKSPRGASLDASQSGPVAEAGGGQPDVTVFKLTGTFNASDSTYRAYGIGTTSCNLGDVPLVWIANTNQHPVIGQNMFRLAPGNNGHLRFEHLGQSWLKHGFFAIDGNECGNCQATGGSSLGVGCSDPYSASRNAGQFSAGPKYQVNSTNGFFPYPPANPTWNGQTARRLKVLRSEVEAASNPGATYYVEGQYVCPDENPSINVEIARNNVSWRRANLAADGRLTGYSGSTVIGEAAIHAWKSVDPEVTLTVVTVPNEGTIWVGSRAYDNGDGTYDYEYAVQNQDVHRSVGSVSVPLDASADMTGVGFRDVDYHSGEVFNNDDWGHGRTGDVMTWETTGAGGNNANAIRWGTLYNFRFTANAMPTTGNVELGMFLPGASDMQIAAAQIPGDVIGGPTCVGDIDEDGMVGFSDLTEVLSFWGACPGCPADIDGNGDVGFSDLTEVLSRWGDCP